jgi:PGF-CTERM protein
VWTSIAVVKIEYRWVPPAELATGQYLIRVNITAASGASGNYDLNFHATSANLTSENPTIPIPIGNPTVAAATSGSPISGFEAAFAVVGLVIIAYVVSRRR